MAKLGIVFDPVYMLHNPGAWHPESPRRLAAVIEAIDSLDAKALSIPARKASRQELELVHSPAYITEVLTLEIKDVVHLDPDTSVSKDSIEAALKAVGGVLSAVEHIKLGKIERVFCAVRPPGHHADRDQAMGFCIFNNVAIGASYALKNYGLKRIAIVDWDLHHGNGTQNAFYNTSEVLYISLHQAPYYPMTGEIGETGEGEGTGYTINIPMVAGSSDDDFREAFGEIIIPALNNYNPELIFISAGFDAHRDDPLGDLYLTSEFFGEMTRMVREVAEKNCAGRIISVLEGGYDLQTLRESVAFHLRELSK